jgi:hypothetical protein
LLGLRGVAHVRLQPCDSQVPVTAAGLRLTAVLPVGDLSRRSSSSFDSAAVPSELKERVTGLTPGYSPTHPVRSSGHAAGRPRSGIARRRPALRREPVGTADRTLSSWSSTSLPAASEIFGAWPVVIGRPLELLIPRMSAH